MKIPRMRIPVFVSAPSPANLNREQRKSADIIYRLMIRYKLEWRALGSSDYSNDLPLKHVLRLARHCSGGIILGFEQFRSTKGKHKIASPNAKIAEMAVSFPTPWNQLEAGILFSMGLPLMVFRERGISGGIFDIGTSEVLIHQMPTAKMLPKAMDELDTAFQNWVTGVRTHYYDE